MRRVLSILTALAVLAWGQAAFAGAIPPPAPFSAWQLRAQRLIASAQASQGQFPNSSPLTWTITTSAANPAHSTIVTDFGVSTAVSPFLAPYALLNDARITLFNSFNMASPAGGMYEPSYMPAESSNTAAMGWGVEFGSDAEACGITIRGAGTGNTAAAIRVKVDGQWTGAAKVIPSGFGNFYEVVYSLGTGNGGPHTWKIYATNGALGGVNCGLAAGSTSTADPYTIWAIPKFASPLVVIHTDSYGGASPLDTTTSDPHQSFSTQLADWMGWDSILTYTSAGQGFVQGGNNNGGLTLVQTLSAFAAYSAADLVVVAEGYNDVGNGVSTAALRAAATTTLAAVRAQYPTAYIIVLGTWSTPAHNSSTAYDDALFNAVANVGDPHMTFISTMGQHGISGTYQNPTNAAWAALYIQPDTVHETDVGARRISQRLAHDIVTYLRTQTGITLAAP